MIKSLLTLEFHLLYRQYSLRNMIFTLTAVLLLVFRRLLQCLTIKCTQNCSVGLQLDLEKRIANGHFR